MFYYLYEIKNLINNKIYVGVHKTNDLNDGYMGSGKVIRSAIDKHGITNFTKVILEQFDDSVAMYAREKEVVTEEFLARPDVYNLRRGGTGGFDYLNRTGLNNSTKSTEIKKLGPLESQRRRNCNPELRNKFSRKISEAVRVAHATQTRPKSIFCNDVFQKEMSLRSRTIETKQKRKETMARIKHSSGEKNSQFGSMWITNGIINKKTKKTNQLPEHWRKGRV